MAAQACKASSTYPRCGTARSIPDDLPSKEALLAPIVLQRLWASSTVFKFDALWLIASSGARADLYSLATSDLALADATQ